MKSEDRQAGQLQKATISCWYDEGKQFAWGHTIDETICTGLCQPHPKEHPTSKASLEDYYQYYYKFLHHENRAVSEAEDLLLYADKVQY